MGQGSQPVLGDVNGDGFDDLLVFDVAVTRWFWTLNLGNGSFGTPGNVQFSGSAGSPVSVFMADLNADGIDDFVTYDAAGAYWAWLYNNGDGTYGSNAAMVFSGAVGATAAVGNLGSN